MNTVTTILEEEGSETTTRNMSNVPLHLSKMIDRFGNRFVFGNACDLWLAPLPIGSDNNYHTHVQRVKKMAIRDNDILICSYPKSGLHWHMEIVSMLIKQRIEYSDKDDFLKAYIENDPTLHVNDEDNGTPRILHTHLPFRYLPKQVLEKRVKVIHLVRNPKDVTASLYCQQHGLKPPLDYPGTFEQFALLLLECGYHYGNIFEHLMGFQHGEEDNPDLPVLTSVFENMKKNPIESIEAINQFLGTNCSGDFCREIADACEFQKLKSFKDKNTDSLTEYIFRERGSFYRKGDIGDWKRWFTVSLNKTFDEQCRQRMDGYKLSFIYE